MNQIQQVDYQIKFQIIFKLIWFIVTSTFFYDKELCTDE